MLPRIALLAACWMSLAPDASCRPILLTCDVTHDQSGVRTRRTVIVDPDRRVVRDNALTFSNGATSRLSSGMEEFVDVDGSRVTWGNRMKASGASAGVIVLDLAQGDYVFTSRFRGRLSHGTCQRGEAAT